jgi:hypothetical protein
VDEPRRRRRLRSGEPAVPRPAAGDGRRDPEEPSGLGPGVEGADADPRSEIAALGPDLDIVVATTEILDPDAPPPIRRSGSDDLPDRDTERGLRVLVGAGTSQVTVAAAMRARDAARPTDDDIANSEANLVIVRRGWVPREQLPRMGNQGN